MLYLVATPIGNLGDMTPRAVEALKNASRVYCEDTRRTRALFSHFGIRTPLLRYDDRRRSSGDEILSGLRSGADLALVSDGGLPCVSDPGLGIVSAARAEGLPATVLPGPSAVAAAVAGSGLPADSFVFLGFLPRKTGPRKRLLERAAALEKTIAVYESPFRVLALLREAAEVLGGCASCAVARELSKLHEEWLFGTVAEVESALSRRAELKGEFVVMFYPKQRMGEV